ncbi:MAG: RHS repeat-associated core domain-containing protein, partial [Thermodesulfobacteriota bacterium]
RTDEGGRTTRYKYDPNGRPLSVTYPGGSTYNYTYDALGNLIQEINPLGGVTTRSYDPLGHIISESDPTGQTWRYKYSNAGSLSQIVDPLGGIIEYRYDTRWHMNEVVDPAGRITRYQYDDKDRVTGVIFPQGFKVTYAYDGEGNLIREADNWGTETKYEYDALGRLITQRRAQGLEITYRYDALGRFLGSKDNMGGEVSLEYNAQGLVSSRRNAAGILVQYRYDPEGRLLEEIDPLEHVSRMEYTPAGQLARMIGPSGDKIQYVYDPSGAMREIHHPGDGVTRFAFDAMGNRIEETNAIGAKSRSVYDKAGRFISVTDAKGQTATFTYDAKGHLVQKRLADGKTVNYKYDSLGNLLEVDDGIFPVRYSYDQVGRITRVEYPAMKRSIQYEYDNEGRAVSMSSEGHEVRRGYDQFGRLGTVEIPGNRTFIFSYDPKDRLISMTYPNGVKGSYEYDRMDRPAKLFYRKSSDETIAGWTYSYDSEGNPIKVIDSTGRITQYVYDRAGQLTEEAGSYGKVNYSYLPGQNRAKMERMGKAAQYSYNKVDQLLKAGEESFKYDANGNLIERQGPKGVTKYTYDSENHLVKVVLPDRHEISFGYAPTGERIWRKDKSGLTWFFTDGLSVLAELDQNLMSKASYLHGPGIDFPLMLSVDGKNYLYHADPLGSIAALTDEDGQVAASYQTDAFGRVLERKGNVSNPFIFTGREYEPELGVYYYRARYYDPGLGRFLGEDPIRNPFKLNKYAYASNAPTRYSDPLGLSENPLLPQILMRHGLTEQQFMDRLVKPMIKNLDLLDRFYTLRVGKEPPHILEGGNETLARNLLRNQLRDMPSNLVGEPGIKIIRDSIAHQILDTRNGIKNPPEPLPPPDPFGGLKIAESSPDNGAFLQNRTNIRPGAGPNLGIGGQTLAHETKVITPGQPAEPASPFDTGAYPPVGSEDTRVIQGPLEPQPPKMPPVGPSPVGPSPVGPSPVEGPSPSLLARWGPLVAGGVMGGLIGAEVGSSYAAQANQAGRHVSGGDYVKSATESAVRADLSVVTLGGSEAAISYTKMVSAGIKMVSADQEAIAKDDAARRQQQEAQKRDIQDWIGQAASLSGAASSLKQRQEAAIDEAKSWLVKAQSGLNKLNQIKPIPENVIQDSQKLCADCQAKLAAFLNTRSQQLKAEINACTSKINANNAVISQAKESLGAITSIVSEISSCGENAWKASSVAKSFPSQCNALKARAKRIYDLIITSADPAIDAVIDSKTQVDDICNEVTGRANAADSNASLADSTVQGLIGRAEALKGQISDAELCNVNTPQEGGSPVAQQDSRTTGSDDLQRRLIDKEAGRNQRRRDQEAADSGRTGYGGITSGSTQTGTGQPSSGSSATPTTGGTGSTTTKTGGTGSSTTKTGGKGSTTTKTGGTGSGTSTGGGTTIIPTTISIRADSGHLIQIYFPQGEGKSVKQETLSSGKLTKTMNVILCPDVKGYVDANVTINVTIASNEAYYVYTIRDVWDDTFRNLVVKRGVNIAGQSINEGDLKHIASDFNVFVDIYLQTKPTIGKNNYVGRTYFCVRGTK